MKAVPPNAAWMKRIAKLPRNRKRVQPPARVTYRLNRRIRAMERAYKRIRPLVVYADRIMELADLDNLPELPPFEPPCRAKQHSTPVDG